MKINIIVAFSKNRGIGINNTLPWNISSDLKKFKNLTIGDNNNAVIMGKNTWDSIPIKYLSHRDNLILSSKLILDVKYENKNNSYDIVKSFTTIDNLLDFCNNKKYDIVWIIGGSQIYNLFMENKNICIDEIYVTYIDSDFKCDTFFPKIDVNDYSNVTQKKHSLNDSSIKYDVYDRIYKYKSK
tara:strand:- start:9966 stop:10517 length:552 start_codon:yes stop_codon:yes gene_type:complete